MVSLAVRQIECYTECKTKDNATMTVRTAIQYRVNKTSVKQAVFEIDNPEAQIRAAVDNVVRSSIPSMDLDDAYSNKDTLCSEILKSVKDAMHPYGYSITNVLVTDLSPDKALLQAMNAQLAARRQREAAIEQGEAQKVLQVKAAEADAEAKYLAGQGIARQRQAIVNGLRESIVLFKDEVQGVDSAAVMDLMLVTQYFDTLKDIGASSKATTVFMPHQPGGVADVASQVRNGFLQGMAGQEMKRE